MALESCPHCGTLNRGCTCLHCGAKLHACGPSTTAASLLGLALVGCVGLKDDIAQPAYGIAISGIEDSAADADDDGFTVAQGDCNDQDASVFPGAEDPLGDGLDTDCDNEDG